MQRLPQPGDALGPFRVVRLLGRGGMGAVYLADDTAIGGQVALKLLDPDVANDPRVRQRALREARAAGTVVHERVVACRGAFDAPGALMIAFEVMPGGSLKGRIKERGRLPWQDAARIGAQVARGLAAVHRAGLIHRDVKPDNVLFAADGTAKLSDLGLARPLAVTGASLTRTGEMLGTVEYFAPEQAAGEGEVGPAADLYALGATLFHALTGEVVFPGGGYACVCKHLNERPRAPRALAPDVPPALDALVLRLLEKEPAARGAGAEDVARELEALLVVAPPRRGSPALVALGAGAVLGLGIWLGRTSAPETPSAATSEPAAVESVAPPAPVDALELEATLGSIKFRHADEVDSVGVVGPRHVVTGDSAGFLHLWDAANWTERAVVRAHVGGVTGLAPVEPGVVLTAGADRTLRRWRVDLDRWRLAPDGAVEVDGVVTDLEVDPTRAFAVCARGIVASAQTPLPGLQVLDLRALRLLPGAFGEGLDGVNGLALLRDGRLVTGSSDPSRVRVWLDPGRPDQARPGAELALAGVRTVAPAAEGGLALVATSDGRVRAWNPDEPGPPITLHAGHAGAAHDLAALPGGRVACVTNYSPGGTVYAWRQGVEAPAWRAAQHWACYQVVASPDEASALVAGGDGLLGVWDLEAGRDRRDFEGGPTRYVEALALLGDAVLTGSHDGVVHRWSPSGAPEVLLRAPRGVLALAATGPWLVSGGWGPAGSGVNVVLRFDARSGQTRPLFEDPSPPRRLAVRERDGAIAVGLEDGRVALWTEPGGLVPLPHRHTYPDPPRRIHWRHVAFVAFRGDDVVSAGGDGRLVAQTGGEPLPSPGGPITAGALRESLVLCGLADGGLALVDLAARTTRQAERRHEGPVRAAAFTPDGARALTASDDGTVRLWSVPDLRELGSVDVAAGGHLVFAVAFAADGGTAYAASRRGVVLRFAVR